MNDNDRGILLTYLEKENEIKLRLLKGEITPAQAEHDIRGVRHILAFLLAEIEDERKEPMNENQKEQSDNHE